jgi:ABC-type thiamin/hydroxymethylpyrimidine transport system permease subunit
MCLHLVYRLMIGEHMDRPSYYFTTRDLLLMVTLAALGGITSTAVNALGDSVQSLLGFAGTTQWAAGLHVLWLTLAAGLTGKLGAGTLAGLLKGGVELFTGNTHGVLVILVDLVAGVLVDLGMLPFRRKDRLLPFAISGGLASASNIFVFQLFASLPADVLAYGALALIGLVAGISGALFAGVLGFWLLSSLQRSGVVKSRTPAPIPRGVRLLFLALVLPMVVGLTAYLRGELRGPTSIMLTGAVANPFSFPDELDSLNEVTRQVDRQGVAVSYSGYPLADMLDYARPDPSASKVLIFASDGYAFFLSMEELEENSSILLSPQEVKGEVSFDVVGPDSSKAWVRGIEKLVVIGDSMLPLRGLLDSPGGFDPQDWLDAMDSVALDLSIGSVKVQGVPLGKILAGEDLLAEASQAVVVTTEGELVLDLRMVLADDDLRIFSLVMEDGIHFVLARMSGEVLAEQIVSIEVR